MDAIGQELRVYREFKGYSPEELARKIKSNQFIVRKHEHDKITPYIDVDKNIVNQLLTAAGCLLGKTENTYLDKDPAIPAHLSELEKIYIEYKSHIITIADSFIKVIKFKNIATV